MATQAGGRQLLTSEDMKKGLDLLDKEMENSELLMSVAPIRLITVGGSLAVLLCGNRRASTDIDCILDPQIAEHQKYAVEWNRVARHAAVQAGLDSGWLNLQLTIFVASHRRKQLFLESVEQDIAIYAGSNLVVYAGKLEWALERKLRRVSHAMARRVQKDVDTPDAAALIKLLRDKGAAPLTVDYLKGLNYNGFDVPPTEDGIKRVAAYYKDTYGEEGIKKG